MSDSDTPKSDSEGIQKKPDPAKSDEAIQDKPTPKPAAKPAAKPVKKPAAKSGGGEDRRGFLGIFTWMGVAWTAFIGSITVLLLETVRFLVPNAIPEEPSTFKAGYPDDYEDGKVVDRYKSKNTWLVKHEGRIYALSTTCTHLGCTPNWLEREQKFKCPCHGSRFYITGINFEGPAPRPLERWAVSIGEDGQIVVDKSKKFQEERNEWDNPESYISV